MIVAFKVMYQLDIRWHAYNHTTTLIFSHPPIREDVKTIMETRWQSLRRVKQDKLWQWLLICDHIPTGPWTGEITTAYGVMTCEPITAYTNP